VPIDNPPPLYETHDYSAVENHITRQNERRVLANKLKNAAVFGSYLKYGSLVIASCGFAALLVLYGLSLLNEEKIRTVEKKIIIEKSNNEESSIQRQLKELEETDKKSSRLQEKPDLKNKQSKDWTDVSTTFTIFKNVPSRISGLQDVVTGHRYLNSKAKYPESQYCYVQIKSSGSTRESMDLGVKEGRRDINWSKYKLYSSQEISPKQFKSSMEGCRFLG